MPKLIQEVQGGARPVRNTALTEALQRATTAEARADSADATIKEAQSSHDTIQEKASEEWQRAEEMRTIATNEYNCAEPAEEEVRKFRQGKASQDVRIRGHLDENSEVEEAYPYKRAR